MLPSRRQALISIRWTLPLQWQTLVSVRQTLLLERWTCLFLGWTGPSSHKACLLSQKACLLNQKTCLLRRKACLPNQKACLLRQKACLLRLKPCLLLQKTCLLSQKACLLGRQVCPWNQKACLTRHRTRLTSPSGIRDKPSGAANEGMLLDPRPRFRFQRQDPDHAVLRLHRRGASRRRSQELDHPGRVGRQHGRQRARAGNTIYFPVNVPGALLFLRDGHAAQGDGEAAGAGIEVPLRAKVQVDLLKKKSLRWPPRRDGRPQLRDRRGDRQAVSAAEAVRVRMAGVLRELQSVLKHDSESLPPRWSERWLTTHSS
jgi:hypothetical protein